MCGMCGEGMEFLNAPYETIQKVTEELVRSDGERYCFSKSQEEVDTLLWEAQLKYVFPLVENYRRYFVKNIMILSKRHFRSTTDMEIRLWFLRKLSLEI